MTDTRPVPDGSDPCEDVRDAQEARLKALLERLAERVPQSPFVARPDDPRLTETAIVDWTGFPARVAGCLSRGDALALLDWAGPSGCEGRLRLQEEYLEWRVVRDPDGVVRRVELTTELANTWRLLAAHAPEQALRQVARFAAEPKIAPASVFGELDPFASAVSAAQRESAFEATMLCHPGPYNNGEQALCCMVNRSNSLEAIASLLFAATFAFVGDDGLRLPARRTIPLLADAAQDGRTSDPVLVERVLRLAFEGRLVGLSPPVGVFIAGVEQTRLRRPDGREVPAEWFALSREAGPRTMVAGPRRFCRLTLEVPADEGLRVGDLVDVATEQPIAYGGQVADLVQLALVLRVSPPGAIVHEQRTCAEEPPTPDPTDCATVRAAWEAFTADAA